MARSRKERINHIQNLAIALLSILAVFLFARSQLDYLDVGREGYFSQLFATPPASAATSQLTELSLPVRIAVTGAYGRYGEAGLSTAAAAFSAHGILLQEALGSAQAVSESSEAAFRAALERTSVYYDFGVALPLPVLGGILGDDGGEALSVRRLLIAAEDAGISLYLMDQAVWRCETSVAAAALEELVDAYQLGNASFAYELEETADLLAPYTLLLTDTLPELPVLSAANALRDTDALLTQVGANPHTNSRYTESSGAEVIVEGDAAFRLHPDGTVRYQGGAQARRSITSFADPSTAQGAAAGAYRFFAALLASQDSSAALCLREVRQSGEGWEISFDYQYEGFRLQRSDGLPAAAIELSGGDITAFTLRLRQYTPTETVSPLLPLTQTLAIARSYPGAEPGVGYLDGGGSEVNVAWLI